MVSAVKNEQNVLSDWLLTEEDEIGRYSRENVPQAANTTLKTGAVVAKNGTGELVEFTGIAGAANVAVGVVVNNMTTGAAVADNVIVARVARVVASQLLWKTGITEPQKVAAMASLAALGIHPVTSA